MTSEDDLDDFLKNNIIKAKKYVNDLEDPYKIEAFKIILSSLLDSNSMQMEPIHNPKEQNKIKITSQNQTTITPENQTTTSLTDLEHQKDVFASQCEITKEELNDIFTIESDRLQLIQPLKGTEKEQMIIACQCLLAAYESLLNQEWVNTLTLTENLRNIGIQDKGYNLSKYLAKNTSLFRSQGRKKNKDYKLTVSGKHSAYKLIKKLTLREDIDET